VNNVRTVSDTKRAFYTLHTRPINSIYRRVVEELMVEMHLLSVNADFRYDAIYALGTVTTFDRFMQGYQPEHDQTSMFAALCQAIESDPQTYRQSAEQLQAEAGQFSIEGLIDSLKAEDSSDDRLTVSTLRGVAASGSFKYSRLFAIGLYRLLECIDPELLTQSDRCNQVLEELGQLMHLPTSKMQKDLELYRSNLDKIVQAKSVMEDILKADRKKKEEREKQRQMAASSDPVAETPETP
jgi:photosystem II biogenesis protein Psp29